MTILDEILARTRVTIQADRDARPDAELEAKMEEVSIEVRKIFRSTDKFQTSERTGFVWLLIRKPTTAEVSTEVSIADRP